MKKEFGRLTHGVGMPRQGWARFFVKNNLRIRVASRQEAIAPPEAARLFLGFAAAMRIKLDGVPPRRVYCAQVLAPHIQTPPPLTLFHSL